MLRFLRRVFLRDEDQFPKIVELPMPPEAERLFAESRRNFAEFEAIKGSHLYKLRQQHPGAYR